MTLDIESTRYLRELRRGMAQFFDLDELRSLMFDLELDWDELTGESKSAKCRACIMLLARQGRLNDLLVLLREERPAAAWPEIPPPDRQSHDERALAAASDGEAFYRDFLNTITQLRAQGLTAAPEHEQARQIARSHTFQALREFDSTLKGKAIRFLYEAGLIGHPHPFYAGEAIIALEDAPLEVADLHAAGLAGVDLSRADLRGADLSQADLRDAYLVGARLAEAKLNAADLGGAILRAAELKEAHLCGANLRGAILVDAVLGWCDLNSATYDRTTVWPAGFDPIAAGAIPSDEAV